MAELRVNNLKKSFGQNEVLKGVSFHLETGKFLSLLVPPAAARPPFCVSFAVWRPRAPAKCW